MKHNLKIFGLALLIVLPFSAMAPRAPGDIDNNGKVNQTDLYMAAGYVLKACPLDTEQLKAADLNGDGKVNSSDLTLLSRSI